MQTKSDERKLLSQNAHSYHQTKRIQMQIDTELEKHNNRTQRLSYSENELQRAFDCLVYFLDVLASIGSKK